MDGCRNAVAFQRQGAATKLESFAAIEKVVIVKEE